MERNQFRKFLCEVRPSAGIPRQNAFSGSMVCRR